MSANSRRNRLAGVVLAAVVVGAAILIAGQIVGGAPTPSAPQSSSLAMRPPLVMPDALAGDSSWSALATAVRAGDVDAASRAAQRLTVATPQERAVRDAALVLADADALGAEGVIEQLSQRAESGDSALAAWWQVQVAVARIAGGKAPASIREELVAARNDAWVARAFDVARIADDLAHPRALPGLPPLAARAQDARSGQGQAFIRRLAVALEGFDRPAAQRMAARAQHAPWSSDPAVAAAIAVAQYDRANPAAAVAAARKITTENRASGVAWVQLGLMHAWARDQKSAQAAWRTATRLGGQSAAHAAILLRGDKN